MHQPNDQPNDYKSAMGGMTRDSTSSMGMEEQDIKDMESGPDVKTEQDGVDNE